MNIPLRIGDDSIFSGCQAKDTLGVFNSMSIPYVGGLNKEGIM